MLIDIPLLYEAGRADEYDFVILVHVPVDLQRKRLSGRNTELSEIEIERRLSAQLPIDTKAERADFVIDNSGTIEKTRAQVEEIWHILCYVAERIH